MRWTWVLFSFSGRISRKWYWIGWLLNMATWMGLGVLLVLLGEGSTGFDRVKSTKSLGVVVFLVLGGAAVWSSLAVQAKRWHDLNQSAWCILINAIPYLGGLASFVIQGFVPGTKGRNRFGKDPLQTAQDWAAQF
ncbi:MAG: DUF805 domain-containing protein [Planctomycetota bacterium]